MLLGVRLLPHDIEMHVPVPFELDLEDVDGRFEKEVLVVRIPKPKKPRRKVEID